MGARDTFAHVDALSYRLRAASTLLGVTDNTLRGYADSAGIHIKRASDAQPGAPSVRIFEPRTLFELAQWRRQQGYLKSPKTGRPIVVTVDIIKGGTGKTTSAVEITLHLQLLGLRCLLIDLDVQGDATKMMGYEPDLDADEAGQFGLSDQAIVHHTLSHVVIPFIENQRNGNNLRAAPGDLIKMPFGAAGPHLLPADMFMSDVEQALTMSRGPRELTIRTLLERSAAGQVPGFDVSNYDVIIFDCPPNVSFTSTAALAASDIVVAPVRLDSFAVKGLSKLVAEINGLKKAYGLDPQLVILPTYYAPQLARIGRMQSRLDQYKQSIAPCVITASEEFPKSLDGYLPISLQKPTSTSSKEYRMFADFLFNKIVTLD